jgi:hypothetical protein
MLASLATIVAQDFEPTPGLSPVAWIVIIVIALVVIAGMWKAFEKAGEPGWGAIIPIFNIYLMLKIGGKPWWWLFLLLVPIVNFIVSIIMNIGISRNFGHGVGFGLGLTFLGFIFWPLLGFGDDQYQPVAA